MAFIKGLGNFVYERFWLSYRSTLIGCALNLAIIVASYTVTALQAIPKQWAVVAGMVVNILLGMLKNEQAVEAAKAAKAAAKVGLVVALLALMPSVAHAHGPFEVCLSGCEDQSSMKLRAALGEPAPVPDFSLHLNVNVGGFGWSLKNNKPLGQMALSVNYVLDWKEKLAVGAGGSFIQTTGDATLSALVGGPVLPWSPDPSGVAKLRPALAYEHIFGGNGDDIIVGTMAMQF